MGAVETSLLILVALVGLFVGAGAGLAFRVSQSQIHESTQEEKFEPPVNPELKSALTAMASSSVIVDSENHIVRADAQAYTLGLVRDEEIAHKQVLEMVEDVRKNGVTLRKKMQLPRSRYSSDSPIYLDVRVAALLGGRVLILIDDETKQKRVDAVRRDFTVNVSHELKTPIGAIGLIAETLQDSDYDPEVVRMFTPKMASEATRLSTLVHDLIELSRLETGDPLMRAQRINIDEVVWEAVQLENNQAAASKIDIEVAEPCGGIVWGDHNLLVTAVRNLVDNAIRYSDPHTRVSVKSSVVDDLVRVAVVDTGIGMDEAEKERVFERFYRVDPGRSRNTGGSGLGLSIVKHVAADHGGTVSVWSKKGHGSTFTLVIPQAEGEEDVDSEDLEESEER